VPHINDSAADRLGDTSIKQQLKAVLNSVYNGIIAVNTHGIITTFNKAAEKILGIPGEQAIGLPLTEVIPNSFQLDTLLKMGKPIPGKQLKIKNSTVVTNINPIMEDGSCVGAVAVFQDITEIKELMEELANTKNLVKTLETILENSYEGIVVVDRNGIITTINRSFARFLGVKPEEAIGRHITEVSPNTKLHQTVETGRIEIGEIHYLGKNRMIVMRIPIFEGEEIVGAIGKILFRDIKELKALVQKIGSMEDELKYYKGELKRIRGAKYNFNNIVAVSKKRKKVIRLAQKAAQTDSTVLICGESGTGKELFAHAIHNSSLRRYGSFIRVNCAAIPSQLLESELFGYEKGAFTGARKEGKPGKFELANGGTIFLDEIGEMPVEMQSKLLRVLQEREIERVGGNALLDIDVRVIAATNKNLEKLVKQGRFREDLYYRLNVMRIDIPPLRETKKDLEPLVKKIINEIREHLGINVKGVSREVLDAIYAYDWPGNVRELKNILERAANMCDDSIIELKHLPLFLREKVRKSGPICNKSHKEQEVLPLKEVVKQAEIRAIRAALDATGGNKKEAARLLGIHRSGLYQKLKAYNIEA